MARPKMPPGQRMTVNLGLRVTDDDVTRLEVLAARLRGMTKHATARVALRIGLEALERDPTRIVIAAKRKSPK